MSTDDSKIIIISRDFSGQHGGGLAVRKMCEILEESGVNIYVFTEGSSSNDIPLSWKHNSLRSFWVSRNPFTRLRDSMLISKKIKDLKPLFVLVVGDLPRISYIFLQRKAPLVFNRHDAMLCCPAGTRHLPVSRTVCKAKFGFSCLAVDKKEGCLGELSAFRKVARIINRKRDGFFLRLIESKLFNSFYSRNIHGFTDSPVLTPIAFNEKTEPGSVPERKNIYELLYIGRLLKIKGYEDALNVLTHLPNKYTLKVIGDGECMQEMKNLAVKLDIKNRVKFSGWLEPVAVEKEIKMAGVLILPSIWDETFGRVGPEALRGGVPVIAYNVGGVSEWCKEPYGTLVECGDVSGLANAVKHITADIDVYNDLSDRCEEWAFKTFSETIFRNSFKNALQSYNITGISNII